MKKMNQPSHYTFQFVQTLQNEGQVTKTSFVEPIWRCQLAHTAHSAQIWQIFQPVFHRPSKLAPQNIFFQLAPHYPISGLPENCSERPGSFFLYSNDLQPAVSGCFQKSQYLTLTSDVMILYLPNLFVLHGGTDRSCASTANFSDKKILSIRFPGGMFIQGCVKVQPKICNFRGNQK